MWSRILLLWLALWPVIAQAEVVILDKGEFALGEMRAPPPDGADWRPVSLPDDWHATRPGTSGVGWYRFRVPSLQTKTMVRTLYIPRASATHIGFYMNGAPLGGTAASPGPRYRLFQPSFATNISPALLRAEGDVLHVRVRADAGFHQGLTRIAYGDGVSIPALQRERRIIQVQAYALIGFAVLLAGCFALVLWARRRSDAVLFWFALAAILHGVPSTVLYLFGSVFVGAAFATVTSIYVFAYVPALVAAVLRFGGLRLPKVEIALWAALLVALTLPHFGINISSAVAHIQVALLSVLGASLWPLFTRAKLGGAPMAALLALAVLTSIALGAHDWAALVGWLDFDRPSLSQFAPFFLMLALGALLVRRNFEDAATIERATRDLERRVAERTAEVERTYARLRGMEREQATVRERQRIMADMHDGLGASLVGLLSLVQGGKVDPKTIEQRVHDALQELRLAVDSLEIAEGDLTTALGTVRHRLRDPLAAAGIELQWQVAEIPHIEQFGASRILNLQRILLEAVTNAVRHSSARQIIVATRMRDEDGELEISVEDDGCGIGPAAQSGGRGMMTMQRRAATLGGRLQVGARPGGGTRIELALSWPPPHPPAS